eukprot:12342768-Alexandrium_andersonii.AAC.1
MAAKAGGRRRSAGPSAAAFAAGKARGASRVCLARRRADCPGARATERCAEGVAPGCLQEGWRSKPKDSPPGG